MEKTILAISGKSGLFTLLSRGRSAIIVETLDETKKRLTVGVHDRIISLNDISMYTNAEDTPLMQVFKNIYEKYDGKQVDIQPKTASREELYAFMETALPDFDADRIYPNDIRKLITWYNILILNELTDFTTPEEAKEAKETKETEA